MESFLIATGVVGLAEIGDKTQLLSLLLAARYRKPIPIVLGVLTATLINHAGAGGVGTLLADVIAPRLMNWVVVISFVLIGGWMLIPDKLEGAEEPKSKRHLGVFVSTVIAFFLAEMGDKTQIATVALAARFHEFLAVVAGTTLGMMLANVPVIYLGHRFADRLPTKAIHIVAALLFVVLGALALRAALYPPA